MSMRHEGAAGRLSSNRCPVPQYEVGTRPWGSQDQDDCGGQTQSSGSQQACYRAGAQRLGAAYCLRLHMCVDCRRVDLPLFEEGGQMGK